jgi:long-subunit acyl-CoA synthetase (AMP-forming)
MTAPAVDPVGGAAERDRGLQSYPAIFQATAHRVADRVALRTLGDRVRLTWSEYAQAVERVSGALAGLGVERGERVAVLSTNRPELAIADVAAMHLGAATVALYTASPGTTIEHVLRDCAPRALIVERDLLPRLNGVALDVAQVVALESLGELPAPAGFRFAETWQSVGPDDLLAIAYTSGTTGVLKGAEWRHREALAAIKRFDALQPEPDGISDISVAPFAHGTERGCGHWRSLLRGSTRTFCPDTAQLAATLLDARPTYLLGPPRLWQNLKRKLDSTLDQLERGTLEREIARVRAGDTTPPSSDDAQTLAALTARIGLDRLNRALTAAAPCPRSLLEHHHALGVGLGVFYGMIETAGITMTRPGTSDLGTAGVPLPGYEIKLADDGEILVQTDSAAIRYRNLPDETAATFAADGWIHTGDIGTLDSDGRLRIIDRKKELLIPDHGHNIAPSQIESELKSACPSIGHVCVIGDGRPHLAALIVLDPPELATDTNAKATVADAIAHVNACRDPREQIEGHAILADPWLPGQELTETQKLRRHRILHKHSQTIAHLYGA